MFMACLPKKKILFFHLIFYWKLAVCTSNLTSSSFSIDLIMSSINLFHILTKYILAVTCQDTRICMCWEYCMQLTHLVSGPAGVHNPFSCMVQHSVSITLDESLLSIVCIAVTVLIL